ncbi:aldehyde ferredoxin oxidoreductase family protein [Chloroflexota bacterium]
MALYGYGKILDVDLLTEKISQKYTPDKLAKECIGGMGFSSKLLFEEVGPDVEPLSPDNILIFANGPLTGTLAPCSGRTEVTTKSPLTGTIGTGNTGGLWGARLKHAGFDMIVVRNQAARPLFLWIDDDTVELRDASHLWGKDTQETSDIIIRELDPIPSPKISVLTIGPAGENLVKYACPVNDYHHVAARCGAGCVMGYKKLKAIVVRGTGMVSIASPDDFREAAREARERLLATSKAMKMPGAFVDIRKDNLERGALPAKNYQTGVLPQWIETRGLDVARKYVVRKEATCFACPISCFNLVEVQEGKYTGVKTNRGTMPGVVACWGAKCAIDNLPAIWKCKEICQKLGMDYDSAGSSVSFAMELFQRGILTTKDTDGLELDWGNEDSTIKLLHQIAYREGLGKTLAEGTVRAAKYIKKGAGKYVMTIKNLEMAMLPDPRAGSRGWLFGSLTNPRGGDNIKNTHCHAERYNPHWWVDKFDIFPEVKEKIYNMSPQEISYTWQGKPLMCRWFEDLYSAINALGICFFPSGFRLAVGPTHLAKLYSACTGWQTTPQDIMNLGEKVFTQLKAYNVRQGFTRKEDNWPDRFYDEPLPEGPSKGVVLSRDTIARLLDEYYELRGWDKVLGMPTEQKFKELGLHDIATELVKLGKLPVR